MCCNDVVQRYGVDMVQQYGVDTVQGGYCSNNTQVLKRCLAECLNACSIE